MARTPIPPASDPRRRRNAGSKLDGSRRNAGSWLDGPPRLSADRPGQRLGLPDAGRGSLASFGERLGALIVDLVVTYGICLLVVPHPGTVSFNLIEDAVFVVGTALLLATSGRTLGMRLLGLQLVRRDGKTIGVRALPRQLLVGLIVPAVIWDRDRRGLHDRACDTLVVRVR